MGRRTRRAYVAFYASEVVLWSRAARRRLEGAHLESRPTDPLGVVDQYGEVLQLIAALHQAIAAVDCLATETGEERPASVDGDLTLRVRWIRHAGTHEIERIREPGMFNITLDGDTLVARSRGQVHRVGLAEIRRALGEMELWAQLQLAGLP